MNQMLINKKPTKPLQQRFELSPSLEPIKPYRKAIVVPNKAILLHTPQEKKNSPGVI